ncbi:PH domain-containing protein [Actinopolymorpha alba]|uniref:PH domain-containing protein n=1 Tax=Actinopolymorpha alba TaxID=533267 RepID=UPI000382A7A7|nr:PH domain-containing protein [Actinopolymorpha alba]
MSEAALMPDDRAPESALPALPHTWRPRFVPVVAVTVAVLLVVAAGGMWILLPADARAQFTWPQTATLGLFLLVLLYGLYRLGRLKVRADAGGLTIVNLIRTRRLEWAEVLRVNLRPGDPWVQLDIDDGTTVQVMAIQSADGAWGKAAARELAQLVAVQTHTSRND